MCLSTRDLLICLQKQTAASAGGIINAVVFFGCNQLRNQLRNLAWRIELAAFFSGVRCKVCNHVFVCIADDIRRIELRGAKVKFLKIFEQILKDSVFLLDFAKIHRRVEINGSEHIVEFRTVVVFDGSKRDVYFLPDFSIVSIIIEICKSRGLVHDKTLTAHSPFNASFVTIILLYIFVPCLVIHIGQILHE